MKKDWLKESDTDRVSVFELLFRSIDRFFGKKILLYGLNNDTKKAIMFLARLHVSVEGFLIVENEKEMAGMEYLGKPVLGKDDFMKMDAADYIVLDVYGDFTQEIWNVLKVHSDTLFEVRPEVQSESFLIYGTRDSGRELNSILARCGLKVFCYCARSAERRDWMFPDCELITPKELDHITKTLPVIIAINNMESVKEVKAILEKKGFSRIYHFDLAFFDLKMWEERTGGSYVPVFGASTLRYFRRNLSKQRKIFFFTNDIPYGLSVLSTMEILGVPLGSIATTAEKNEYMEETRIVNAYDLLYEAPSDFVVLALPGDEESAIEFMMKSGLPEDIFLLGPWGPWHLNRKTVLDTHLGYADGRGLITVRNCVEEENVLKVAILGGSTSDYDEFFERSWPSWLLELAQKSGMKMECIMAARSGYTSSQELVRLIRDVLGKKPDIVISYSGINEYSQTVKGYRFTHIYQKEMFEEMSNSKKNGMTFSMGERQDDAPMNWITNERIMYAICQEFGILFYGILQASPSEKKPRSRTDLEIMEHVELNFWQMNIELMKFVKREKVKYPWLYDFTGIFDGIEDEVFFDSCHVYGDKNRLIAEGVLSIIQEAEEKNA